GCRAAAERHRRARELRGRAFDTTVGNGMWQCDCERRTRSDIDHDDRVTTRISIVPRGGNSDRARPDRAEPRDSRSLHAATRQEHPAVTFRGAVVEHDRASIVTSWQYGLADLDGANCERDSRRVETGHDDTKEL